MLPGRQYLIYNTISKQTAHVNSRFVIKLVVNKGTLRHAVGPVTYAATLGFVFEIVFTQLRMLAYHINSLCVMQYVLCRPMY